MQKILSFIIPAYNSQRYLKKCLDSFLVNEQPLQETEVIVINDGSTDCTGAVAEEYVARFPDIYRVVRKENGGHGSVINAGSRIATGKYIKVVDADDWVISENLPEYVKALKRSDADVVLTPYHEINIKTGEKSVFKMYCKRYGHKVTLGNITEGWKEYSRCMTFHGITYRTDFYNQNRHELPEKIFYEDQEYASIPCCHAESICPLDIFVYQYAIGNSTQSVSDNNRLKRQKDAEQVTKDILLYSQKNSHLSSAEKEYLRKKIDSLAMSHYVLLCLIQNDKKKGRKDAGFYHDMIREADEELSDRLEKKYRIFLFLNRIHMSHKMYQRLLRTRTYNIVRRTHRIEKESNDQVYNEA